MRNIVILLTLWNLSLVYLRKYKRSPFRLNVIGWSVVFCYPEKRRHGYYHIFKKWAHPLPIPAPYNSSMFTCFTVLSFQTYLFLLKLQICLLSSVFSSDSHISSICFLRAGGTGFKKHILSPIYVKNRCDSATILEAHIVLKLHSIIC